MMIAHSPNRDVVSTLQRVNGCNKFVTFTPEFTQAYVILTLASFNISREARLTFEGGIIKHDKRTVYDLRVANSTCLLSLTDNAEHFMVWVIRDPSGIVIPERNLQYLGLESMLSTLLSCKDLPNGFASCRRP